MYWFNISVIVNMINRYLGNMNIMCFSCGLVMIRYLIMVENILFMLSLIVFCVLFFFSIMDMCLIVIVRIIIGKRVMESLCFSLSCMLIMLKKVINIMIMVSMAVSLGINNSLSFFR